MIKKAHIFLLICIVFVNSGCEDLSVQNEDIQYSSEQLQAVVDENLKDKTNVLGTIVKVDIQGKESYEAVSGYFDSSRTIPVKPNTNFIIGSITKVFTAVLVHQLVEEGYVQLQSPLINYLPPDWSAILKKIEYGNEITVKQALSHRSGIADMTESEAFWKSLFFDSTKKWNSIDIIKMVQEKDEANFKPGKNFQYSNSNYILLGALIENVSGISYRESLQENILERIGLDNTFLVEETFGSHTDTIAHGYSRIDDKLYDGHEIRVEWTLATGGIVSNADDLIKFYKALVSGSIFDNKETYKQMCHLVGHNESYGQGLEVINDPDIGLHYGHRGSLLNTRAILMYFPEKQMTISICHTYDGFSMLQPESLMTSVVQSMMDYELTEDTDIEFLGPDILADTSNVIDNEDMPTNGDWDFDLKEEWSLSRIGAHSFVLPGNLHVGDDGELYLLDRGSAKILVLDPDGNLLYSFGGHGDGPLFEYPLDLYVTSDNIHVLDMGRTGDKIKTYDKKGNYVKTSKMEAGVSPRVFVNADQYIAVRSGSDIENRPKNELLELISLKQKKGSVLTKIVAEDKLVLTTILPRGRYILGQNDIEIFPRLIIHFDKNTLYLGRSDKYLIKKIDLSGKEQLAFSIKGRERDALPPNHGVDRANKTRVGRDKKMPEEMKEKFVAQFPDRHTYYTKITTDEEGLIYVFVPDIMDLGKQEIDIFSPEGKYLYHSVIELPDGLEKIRPFVLKGEHLFALVKSEKGVQKFVKYKIRRPEYSNHI